jgi:hypothetical protein
MNFKRLNIELPESFVLGSRRVFLRSKVEHHKRCLIARSQGLADPPYSAPPAEEFVTATQVARELGIAPRTMARRVRESEERRDQQKSA